MNRLNKVVVSVLFVALLFFLEACSKEEETPKKDAIDERAKEIKNSIHPKPNRDGNYNIVMIVVDQQHYFSKYPYGTAFNARQLLEKLGTTFEKHYACSNMSTSSRSVIYSGQHITQTTMIDNTDYPWQDELPDTLETIGDMMRKAGFITAYKGKFHMGNASIINEDSSTDQQQQDMLKKYGFSDWNARGDYVGTALGGFAEDPSIRGDSIEWLRNKGLKENNEGKSFFLAINYINPHDIMFFNTDTNENIQWKDNLRLTIAKALDINAYKTRYPETSIPISWSESFQNNGRVPAHEEYLKLWDKSVGHIPSESSRWEAFRDFYYNSIKQNDNEIMTLLNELIRLEMLNNTIIIFTSDHGEMQGAHGLRGKGGNMYENNIHVPMTIFHPEHLDEKRISKITNHLDLAPTIIGMTNIPQTLKSTITAHLNGYNLVPYVSGNVLENEPSRQASLFAFGMLSMIDSDMTFIQNPTNPTPNDIVSANIDYNKKGFVRGITTEKYKFARYFSPLNHNKPTTIDELFKNNDVELFDLENDPDEMNNLAADRNKNSELIMELNSQLNAIIADEIGEDSENYVSGVIDRIEAAK